MADPGPSSNRMPLPFARLCALGEPTAELTFVHTRDSSYRHSNRTCLKFPYRPYRFNTRSLNTSAQEHRGYPFGCYA